jgi:hypothetical protein
MRQNLASVLSVKLPNAHQAVVERAKLAEYLLSSGHRYGASNAQFFLGFGFTLETWEVLAEAFREHGQRHEVTGLEETAFGPRYEVEGELHPPDGRNPHIRTVWQVDKGHLAPRLITAYPGDKIP